MQRKESQTPSLTLRLRRNLHEVSERGRRVRVVLSDAPNRQDNSTISLQLDDRGRPIAMQIERAVHSYFPVYFHIGQTGEAVISDTMGFMHDIARRGGMEIDDSAQLEHLLFGRPPERGLLREIYTVDHGEQVRLVCDEGRWRIESSQLYDHFLQDDFRGWEQSLPQISEQLRQATSAISPSSMLFSGGVDSTLLKAMLGGQVEMLSGRVPGEQFVPEVEQAARAAALLDGDHRYVDVDHGDYLELLVDLTRRTGLPCPAMQHVLQTRVAASAKETVCYGELGDGTYGLPLVGQPGLREWLEQSGYDASYAASLRYSVASMRGEDTSFDRQLEATYGSIDEAHRRRGQRVAERMQWDGGLDRDDRIWERFLAIGHMVDFLTVGCVKVVRDLASSHGAVVHTPYTDRGLIDSFHRCDPATRYCDAGRAKPVLKTLLARALPAYDVDRPKLASGLPRSWYFTEGPLQGVFDDYPPPSPMAEAVERAVENPGWNNSWILWPVLSYSVWYHEWFEADALTQRSDMVVHQWGTAPEQKSRIAS